MRRMIALWTSVLLATFVAGLGVAQDGAGDPGAGDPGAGDPGAGDPGAGDPGAGDPGTDDPSSATDATGGDETAADPGSDTAGDGEFADPTAPPDTGVTGGEPGSAGSTRTSAERDEGMDAGTYAVRLRDLEQRINELKEQIFRSKARLSLLAETVLQGVVAGAQAVIIHENRMSSSYRLVKAVYALDGARIFSKADEEGSLGEQRELEIYDGSIVPGEHTLTVNLEYRGHGYGIFSYLKGYRFRVRSNYSFTAPEGKAVTIRVVGYEKGGPTAPLEERPAIRYQERTESSRRGASRDDEGEGEE